MRRKTARYASLAIVSLLFGRLRFRQALALEVGGQCVVLLQVAEGRLRPAHRVRRDGRALAARVDAGLGLVVHRPSSGSVSWTGPSGLQPGVVFPRLGL